MQFGYTFFALEPTSRSSKHDYRLSAPPDPSPPPPMDLSLGRLQQLVTVAKRGSFSRAAVALNISQPALSRSIAAIEARYGFPIFNRVGHGVEPTTAGAQVIAHAEQLLQHLRVFDSNLKLIGAGEAGQLSMGMAPLLASQWLARFTSDFFAARAQAALRVLIRPGKDLLAALKSDAIELFFFPESYIEPSPDLVIERLGSIRSAFVVRSGHPLTLKPKVTLEDLSRFPWASAVEPNGLPQIGPAQLSCDNYHIIRDAVLETDLVCICSAEFVAQQISEGSLRELEVEGFPLGPTSIYTASLRGRVNSPLAQAAAERMAHYLR